MKENFLIICSSLIDFLTSLSKIKTLEHLRFFTDYQGHGWGFIEGLFNFCSWNLKEDFVRQIEDNEHLWTFDETNLHQDRN